MSCSVMNALSPFSDVVRLLYTYDVLPTLTNLNVTDTLESYVDKYTVLVSTWLTVRPPELYHR